MSVEVTHLVGKTSSETNFLCRLNRVMLTLLHPFVVSHALDILKDVCIQLFSVVSYSNEGLPLVTTSVV